MEEEVIADLRSKLKEAESERLKAAQYGLQLLESQNELQNQLDKCRNEMMTMTEVGLQMCRWQGCALLLKICLCTVLPGTGLVTQDHLKQMAQGQW